MSEPTRSEPTPGAPLEPSDDLETVRGELDQLHDVPVADRVALFERVNATLARELADLDEV